LTISYLTNVPNTDDGKGKMEIVEHVIKLDHEKNTINFFYQICKSVYFPDEVMSVLAFHIHDESDNYIPGYIMEHDEDKPLQVVIEFVNGHDIESLVKKLRKFTYLATAFNCVEVNSNDMNAALKVLRDHSKEHPDKRKERWKELLAKESIVISFPLMTSLDSFEKAHRNLTELKLPHTLADGTNITIGSISNSTIRQGDIHSLSNNEMLKDPILESFIIW
jgi:hypothetical protein